MKVVPEVFKGIEFIRICNLPEDQKEFVVVSVATDRIIKILKNNVVLRDCIQYHDYLSLYDQFKAQVAAAATTPKNNLAQVKNPSLYKLAFK